jgi:hypothetical protein
MYGRYRGFSNFEAFLIKMDFIHNLLLACSHPYSVLLARMEEGRNETQNKCFEMRKEMAFDSLVTVL